MKRILMPILLLCSALCQAQVPSFSPAHVPAYFSPQFVGVHAHNPEVAALYPKGPFGSWRTWDGGGAGTWQTIQPTSATGWSWVRTDAYMDLVEQTPGTKVLLTFGRTPAWASARPIETSAYGAGMAAEPVDVEKWRAYVRAVATRYAGRVEAYQTWNEANTTPFYSGTMAKLVELTCIAYAEIKQADPDALVVSPSGTGAWADRTAFVKQFLDAGGKDCIDVISYHLYTSGSPPENFVLPMLDMRAQLAAGGYSRFPLWNTETGYLMPGTKLNATSGWTDYEKASAVNNYDAADFMVRAMLLARAVGFERFYWYAWDDMKFGFIEPNSKLQKDTAAVVHRFSNAFIGTGLMGSCNKSIAGVWQCFVKVAAGSTNAQVLWVDPSAAAQSQNFTLPLRGTVSNFHSDATQVLPAGSVVTLSTTPQLIVW